MNKRGFTLPELLVVLAIIVVLASVLFPVFVSAKAAAQKTACFSNFKQGSLAVSLYLGDYDDTYMPTNYQPDLSSTSRTDRTWVQLVMPYVATYSIFKCPSDNTDRPKREATFDQDLVPGDTYSQYYTASLRTNMGYNYLYFSPILKVNGQWQPSPRVASNILDPSNTILFVDSVWTKPEGSSFPTGGGSYVVMPPCRYVRGEGTQRLDTFNGYSAQSADVFTSGAPGWDVSNQPLRWGGAWPWHSQQITALTVAGGVRLYKPDSLAIGCDLQPNWQGFISDSNQYLWDLN